MCESTTTAFAVLAKVLTKIMFLFLNYKFDEVSTEKNSSARDNSNWKFQESLCTTFGFLQLVSDDFIVRSYFERDGDSKEHFQNSFSLPNLRCTSNSKKINGKKPSAMQFKVSFSMFQDFLQLSRTVDSKDCQFLVLPQNPYAQKNLSQSLLCRAKNVEREGP